MVEFIVCVGTFALCITVVAVFFMAFGESISAFGYWLRRKVEARLYREPR